MVLMQKDQALGLLLLLQQPVAIDVKFVVIPVIRVAF